MDALPSQAMPWPSHLGTGQEAAPTVTQGSAAQAGGRRPPPPRVSCSRPSHSCVTALVLLEPYPSPCFSAGGRAQLALGRHLGPQNPRCSHLPDSALPVPSPISGTTHSPQPQAGRVVSERDSHIPPFLPAAWALG